MLEQLSIEIKCSNKSLCKNPAKRKVKEVHCILDWDYLHIFSSCVELDVVLKVADVQPAAGLGAVKSKWTKSKMSTIIPSCPLAIEEDLALCRSGPCKIHLNPSEFIWYIYIYWIWYLYLIYKATLHMLRLWPPVETSAPRCPCPTSSSQNV